PILARPAGIWERALKFTRRNQLLVGSTAAIFVSLLVALITSGIALSKENPAKIDAVDAREKEKEKTKQAKESEAKEKRAKEDLKTENLNGIVQSARMARQRGQVTLALELIDRAMKEGHPATVEL